MTLEVRPELGSVLAARLLSSVLSDHTTPKTKTNTVSSYHKHCRFIVTLIEYISPSVEKSCLTLRSLLVNSNDKRHRSTGVKEGCVKNTALLRKSLKSRKVGFQNSVIVYCTAFFLLWIKKSIYSLLN